MRQLANYTESWDSDLKFGLSQIPKAVFSCAARSNDLEAVRVF